MKEPHTHDEKTVETLSHKYSYEDFIRMQQNAESISVTTEDMAKAEKDRIIITKDTPNPFGKRILIELLLLIAVMVISILLFAILENENIYRYVSSIGIGLIAIELSSDIIRYIKFNKLKKNSKEQ